MSLVPQRFQKRPLQIHAIQFDGTAPVTEAILKWAGNPTIGMVGYDPESNECDGLEIETLEGTMIASVGDYVIRGIKGEFYPVRADIFEATYELVYDPEQDPDQPALFPRD